MLLATVNVHVHTGVTDAPANTQSHAYVWKYRNSVGVHSRPEARGLFAFQRLATRWPASPRVGIFEDSYAIRNYLAEYPFVIPSWLANWPDVVPFNRRDDRGFCAAGRVAPAAREKKQIVRSRSSSARKVSQSKD